MYLHVRSRSTYVGYRYVPYVGTYIPYLKTSALWIFEKGVAGPGGAYGYIYGCTYVYSPTLMMRKVKERKERKGKEKTVYGSLERGFFSF